MTLSLATLNDIPDVLQLHFRYQVDSIDVEDKKDGFVTTAFTTQELTELILQEQGLFIARVDGEVVAYVMAASWQFWSQWPMFAYMIKSLDTLSFLGQDLSVDNSYQYGPVCIDKSVRSSGMLEAIFEFSRQHMTRRYPILVTFINKINPRSYAAHTRKLGLEVIKEFTFNNNNYYELVYDTSKPLS